MSAWRKPGSLAFYWAQSEDTNQIVRMCRVFAGRTRHFVCFVVLRLSWWKKKNCSRRLYVMLVLRSVSRHLVLSWWQSIFADPLIDFIRVRYVYVKRDRETYLCQLKHISAHNDVGCFGHSGMHYMPIYTKLSINMRITWKRTPQNRCKSSDQKLWRIYLGY